MDSYNSEAGDEARKDEETGENKGDSCDDKDAFAARLKAVGSQKHWARQFKVRAEVR